MRDIAEVVVAALTAGDRYVRQDVALSGPRRLSFREAVAEISEATGGELTYLPVTARRYGVRLAGFGVPPEEVEFLVDLFESAHGTPRGRARGRAGFGRDPGFRPRRPYPSPPVPGGWARGSPRP
ncbi:hypothetical protein [Streptomyces sp. NBC_01384]|uniref:hypothetical protein n=1 Tax=Streptomyces sp. NBC_01384 TaxID=2903847 RepID=UPI00386FDE16